jgi:hypothetical protein
MQPLVNKRKAFRWVVGIASTAAIVAVAAITVTQFAEWPESATFADRLGLAGIVLALAALAVAIVGLWLALDQIDLTLDQSRKATTAAAAAREAVERAEGQLRRNSTFTATSDLLRQEGIWDNAVRGGEVAQVRLALLDWRRAANSLRMLLEDVDEAAEFSQRLRDAAISATDTKVALDLLPNNVGLPAAVEPVRKMIAEVGSEAEAFQEKSKFHAGGTI